MYRPIVIIMGKNQLVNKSTCNNGESINQRVNYDTKFIEEKPMKLKEKSKRSKVDIVSICKAINQNEEKNNLPNIDKDNSDLWMVRANTTMSEAAKQKDRLCLYKKLWYEGEICILFAKSGNGKSILAVQIAEEIAKRGQMVNYLDYELEAKQFQQRYCNEKTKENYKFSDNHLRADLSVDLELNSEGRVKRFFEQIVKLSQLGVKKFILDNITSLIDRIENGDVILEFMRTLKYLKEKYELSILIVAHTTKKNDTSPLNQDYLAGSKKLMNFADSAFAIGKSLIEPDIRYIKQLKVRVGKFTFDENNVMLCQIVKKNNFPRFVECGFAVEKDLLNTKKSIAQADKKGTMFAAYNLYTKKGMSYRQIGKELGVSDKTIAKWIKQVDTTKELTHT